MLTRQLQMAGLLKSFFSKVIGTREAQRKESIEMMEECAEAVKNGDLETLKHLYHTKPLDINKVIQTEIEGKEYHCCLLTIACYHGYMEIVEYLIECGAYLESGGEWEYTIADDESGEIYGKGTHYYDAIGPLYIACKRGHGHIVELMFRAGAPGRESIYKAITNSQLNYEKFLALAKKLIGYGASIHGAWEHAHRRYVSNKGACAHYQMGYCQSSLQRMEEFFEKYEERLASVCDLKGLCRLSVCKHLWKVGAADDTEHRIRQLPLPSSIKRYLIHEA